MNWSIKIIVLLRFLSDVCNQLSGTAAHVTPFNRFPEAFKLLLKIKMAKSSLSLKVFDKDHKAVYKLERKTMKCYNKPWIWHQKTTQLSLLMSKLYSWFTLLCQFFIFIPFLFPSKWRLNLKFLIVSLLYKKKSRCRSLNWRANSSINLCAKSRTIYCCWQCF